jgi:putative transposase
MEFIKYASYNDLKAFSRDFKTLYTSENEEIALSRLDDLKKKWGKDYPYAFKS